MDKFNYCIAHYWDDDKPGNIGTYTYFGEVHHGTLEDAQGFLEYVMRKSPEEKWQIFKITPLVEPQGVYD